MPEGDTIHRSAARLRAALEGHPLVRLELPAGGGRRSRTAPAPPPAPGTVVEQVTATGKHLLIRFGDGTVLRTHLGMPGSWHLYRPGDRWTRPRHQARAVVAVDGWEAVCFAAPVVELTPAPGAAAATAHLGPDLCRPDVDLDEVLRRLDELVAADREIGDVLLDQRVAAGIGNVYKSEALFACGVDPFAAVGDLDRGTRRRLLGRAATLLRSNLTAGGRRRTTGGGLAVYGRAGRPCRRCGSIVRSRRQGRHARTTYWCPTCQASRKGTGAGAG